MITVGRSIPSEALGIIFDARRHDTSSNWEAMCHAIKPDRQSKYGKFISFSSTQHEAHSMLANPPHHNPVSLSVSGLSHFPHILPTQDHQHHNTQRESSMLISPWRPVTTYSVFLRVAKVELLPVTAASPCLETWFLAGCLSIATTPRLSIISVAAQ
jgi:hypothetical protein